MIIFKQFKNPAKTKSYMILKIRHYNIIVHLDKKNQSKLILKLIEMILIGNQTIRKL